jgi:hypothetical protein
MKAKRGICLAPRIFKGLVLKILIEKYFVRKSHKIKREICLTSAISRGIRWRVVKKSIKKTKILYLTRHVYTNDDPYDTPHSMETEMHRKCVLLHFLNFFDHRVQLSPSLITYYRLES